MKDNSFAIYQVKEDQDYHMLRFASMDELKRDGLRLRRDVHKVLTAAEGNTFPDKAAAEQFLRDEGFQVIHNDDPQMITVRNVTRQETTLYLTLGDGCCWLEGCDTRKVDQIVKPESYELIYSASLPPTNGRDQAAILESLYARFNLDLTAGETPSFETLFSYFPHWKTVAAAQLLQTVYIFLWTLLLVIPGIVAGYSYAMTGYILAEHPELSASEAIAQSKAMMEGNRWRLFCLQFSFIGWDVLCALTLGIGNLALRPYRHAAEAAFYRKLYGGTVPEDEECSA